MAPDRSPRSSARSPRSSSCARRTRTLRGQVGLTQQVEQLDTLEQENARLTRRSTPVARWQAATRRCSPASSVARPRSSSRPSRSTAAPTPASSSGRRPLRRRRARRVDRRGGTDLQLRAAHQRLALPRSGRDSKTKATDIINGRLSAPLEMTDIRITDAIEVGHAVICRHQPGSGSSPCSRQASSSARSSTSTDPGRSSRPPSWSPPLTSTISNPCSSSPTTSARLPAPTPEAES